jgi:cytochrome c553
LVTVLVALAFAAIYGGSSWAMRKHYAVPASALLIPGDAASIAEGARMARIASCRDCHGMDGQGRVLFDVPMVGRVAPPALARAAATMTDAELVAAIRQGVHKDGTSLYVMPAHALSHLSDEDVGRIVAWIRTLEPNAGDSLATTQFGPGGRAMLLAGKLPAMAIAGDQAPARAPADRGKYIVDVGCLACHKLNEPGAMEDGGKVPPLATMVAAYDPAALRHLLSTGEGMTKRDLGVMRVVGRDSFGALTDAEVAQVQAYLTKVALRDDR